MTTKIRPQHLSRTAFVYIRQSTMGQVRFHRESTEHQYALKDKALELGWADHHPGYLSWAQYEGNLKQLTDNRTNKELSGPAREG